MDFFLEMLLTAILSLFFSFLVSKLVSVAMAGNSGGRENDPTSDQAEKPDIGVGDDFVTKELRFALKINAPVLESERNFRVVDQNVETVNRYGIEADRVDELEEAATGNGNICAERKELVVRTAEAESTAAVSPEIVIAKDMIVCGQDERSDSAGQIGAEREELMVRTTEAVSTASVSPERVVVEEVRVESSNAVEESEYKMEWNTEEEKEEEDDDWEGIERSELEKAFAAAANFLEESAKAEEIGAKAKMELYGLHKIATEGSCREAQPMAVMVSARAKWNAWEKLGNMNQEEAMEQYLALVSKEIPVYNVGKMPEMVTSVVLHPISGTLEDPTTLATTCVASSKNGER